ncbi:hypothetical protein U91I_01577 [alpha proteobacterium U9-1i]|nr:hypothetical protein U91I_01577 [alpha proteobacterium U9-1i]
MSTGIKPMGRTVRRFTMADQLAFAEATGDRNPLHLDAHYARRTQAGAPVVHGMHCALWALEMVFSRPKSHWRPSSISVQFKKFVFLDTDVELDIECNIETRTKLIVRRGETIVCAITMLRNQEAATVDLSRSEGACEGTPSRPRELTCEAAAGLSGRFCYDDTAATLFPAASGALGERRIAGLAALSTLVGMVCPGLNSLFSSFSVVFSNVLGETAPIEWSVVNADSRFQLLSLSICGPGFLGTVDAFFRGAPVETASMDELARLVERDEFVGQRAFVVGGARGLGAAIVKLLAAGGGQVVFTYASSGAEANALVSEVAGFGRGSATALEFDARGQPSKALMVAAKSGLSHLYYCATPKIFRQIGVGFSPSIFAEFAEIYLDGFANTLRILASAKTADAPLTIIFPSTIAIEERPPGLTEYAMAKAAGEVLAADLGLSLGARVFAPRLPRMLTDQTNSVPPIPAPSAVDVILPMLRAAYTR